MSDWSFDWRCSVAEAEREDFVAVWSRLIEQSAQPVVFRRPEVVLAWLDTCGPEPARPPFVGLATDDTGAQVLACLEINRSTWRNAWAQTLRCLAEPEMDYCDPVVGGPAESVDWVDFWRQASESLRGRGVRFDRVRIGNLTARFAACGSPESAKFRCTVLLPLQDYRSAEDLLLTRSGKTRYNLRRQERLLSRDHGEVGMKTFGPGEAQSALAEMDRFVEVRNDYRTQQGAPRSMGDAGQRYFQNLVSRALPTGLLHFSILTAGEQTISWHMGFVADGKFMSFLIAYDTEFKKYAPGTLHRLRLFDYAIGLGCEEFDFLRGEEDYKQEWPAVTRDLYTVSWLCATPRGLAARALACRGPVVRLVRRLPGLAKRGTRSERGQPASPA